MQFNVLAVTAVTAALLAPSVAAAGPKVAVDFLCGVYAHDEITTILPSPAAPRIDQPVACVLHLTKPGSATYHASIATVRHLVNPTTGAHADVPTLGATGEVSHRAGSDGVDLEVVLTPDQADGNGELPFAACERFDIVGRLTDDRGEVWTQTLAIEQRCPVATPPAPPRTLEGRGTGNATADDLLPGNAQPWVGHAVQVGPKFLFAVGGCDYDVASTMCAARVFTAKGKLAKALEVDIADPADEGQVPDFTELDLARADLDGLFEHGEGYPLLAHDLTKGPVTFQTVALDWNQKRSLLTIRNHGKVWKKIKTPRASRHVTITSATLFFQDAGDPVAGVLRITTASTDDNAIGLSGDDLFAVVPLPPMPVD